MSVIVSIIPFFNLSVSYDVCLSVYLSIVDLKKNLSFIIYNYSLFLNLPISSRTH